MHPAHKSKPRCEQQRLMTWKLEVRKLTGYISTSRKLVYITSKLCGPGAKADDLMPERTVLLALALAAVSGLLGLPFSRRSPWGQRLTTLVAVAAGSLGLAGVAHYWQRGDSEAIVYPWN